MRKTVYLSGFVESHFGIYLCSILFVGLLLFNSRKWGLFRYLRFFAY
ncbi:unnamed protein product [Acanthoscelides obtectus]|uniref:Uncharacterized protein n=1 Tax=Acanthoscelides obtectus TaxID=200917 RepID=A0A9P0LVN3_ACAOB|nr:unnamed protein product [Acanthoscelides obtectus]CAK1623207.1 hypothetical protein AOBTE_LOCUS1883 [Acanthoscelides obtectus]